MGCDVATFTVNIVTRDYCYREDVHIIWPHKFRMLMHFRYQ